MKWLSRFLVLAGFAVSAAVPTLAHAQIDSGMVPLRTAISELNSLRTQYAEMYNKKDVAGLVATYDPGAIAVMSNGTVLMGSDAIRKSLTTDAPNFPHLVIKSDTMRVFGNTAIDEGTLTMHPSSGGEMVERYLVVLRRNMNGWHLIRTMSVPVAK